MRGLYLNNRIVCSGVEDKKLVAPNGSADVGANPTPRAKYFIMRA